MADNNNKKMLGCGCFSCGCGCLAMILFVAAVTAFGYYYAQTSGRSYVAKGFNDVVCKFAENVFEGDDLAEIKAVASDTASNISSGKMGFINMIQTSSQVLSEGMHVQGFLYAFMSKNLMNAAQNGNSGTNPEGINVINTLMYNIQNKTVSSDAIASITGLIVAREPKSGSDININGANLDSKIKENLTDDQKLDVISKLKDITELNRLSAPGADYNPKTALKNQLLDFMNRLNNPETVQQAEKPLTPASTAAPAPEAAPAAQN